MRILLTCFEPFGGSTQNASQEVSRLLAAAPPPGIDLRQACLPVVTERAGELLSQALREHDPQAVIALGESSKAEGIVLERVALNLRDYSIADNAGNLVRDAPVEVGGPGALFGSLPYRQAAARLEEAGFAPSLSLSAGSFLCNEVFYRLLRSLGADAHAPARIPAAFVHLPRLPQQATGEGPSRAAEESARAVAVLLQSFLA